jgi:hypothetical protein
MAAHDPSSPSLPPDGDGAPAAEGGEREAVSPDGRRAPHPVRPDVRRAPHPVRPDGVAGRAPDLREGEAGGSSVSWRLLSAPTTGVGLGAALALQLFGAAFVPDDLAPGDLARGLGFGRAEVAQGLGLSDPAGSWLFWLLVLLCALHLLARVVGAGSPVPRARPEALTLLGLGLAAGLAGLVEGRGAGLDARLNVPLGGGAASMGEVEVARGVRVKRALPLGVTCEAPDPRDPTGVVACTVTSAGGEQRLRLAPAEVTEAAGMSLSLLSSRWRPPSAPSEATPEATAQFLWWQAERPQRLALKVGAVGAAGGGVDGGDRSDDGAAGPGGTRPVGAARRFEASVDAAAPAPLLRVAEGRADRPSGQAASSDPVLFWPNPGAGAAAGERFEALLPQEVTLRIVARPGHARLLVGLGLALSAAGLLLLAVRTNRVRSPASVRTNREVA